jgi:hypothetical protein
MAKIIHMEKENLEYRRILDEERIKYGVLEKENEEKIRVLTEQTNNMAQLQRISADQSNNITQLQRNLTEQANKINQLEKGLVDQKNSCSSMLSLPNYGKGTNIKIGAAYKVPERGWIFVQGCGSEKNGVPVCYLNINGNDYLVGYAHCHGHGSFFAPVEKQDTVYVHGGVFQKFIFYPCR